MNLKQLKEKALELKKQAKKKAGDALDYGAKKLVSSSFTITSKEQLQKFIEKSAETTFKNKETGKEKKYSHRVIVIFWEEKSDFFKKALYHLPIIATKWFTQNIPVKLAKSKIEWVDLKKFKISTIPSIVVIENKKIYKIVSWEENILKLVKSFNLDINKQIDSI
jgi:hypothetical protein